MKRARFLLAVALLAVSAGCVGYVDGDGGAAVVVPGPDFYGGFYGPGRAVGAFHDRGIHSRGIAHPSGGRRR